MFQATFVHKHDYLLVDHVTEIGVWIPKTDHHFSLDISNKY